jgi:hypothetical protein
MLLKWHPRRRFSKYVGRLLGSMNFPYLYGRVVARRQLFNMLKICFTKLSMDFNHFNTRGASCWKRWFINFHEFAIGSHKVEWNTKQSQIALWATFWHRALEQPMYCKDGGSSFPIVQPILTKTPNTSGTMQNRSNKIRQQQKQRQVLSPSLLLRNWYVASWQWYLASCSPRVRWSRTWFPSWWGTGGCGVISIWSESSR